MSTSTTLAVAVAAPVRPAAILNAVFAALSRLMPRAVPRDTAIETASVWELYRIAGGADSVRPAVMAHLARD